MRGWVDAVPRGLVVPHTQIATLGKPMILRQRVQNHSFPIDHHFPSHPRCTSLNFPGPLSRVSQRDCKRVPRCVHAQASTLQEQQHILSAVLQLLVSPPFSFYPFHSSPRAPCSLSDHAHLPVALFVFTRRQSRSVANCVRLFELYRARRFFCRDVPVIGKVCNSCSEGCDPKSVSPPVGFVCPSGCVASNNDDGGGGGDGGASVGHCKSHAECAAEAATDPDMQGLTAYCGEVTIGAMMGNGGSDDPVTACW